MYTLTYNEWCLCIWILRGILINSWIILFYFLKMIIKIQERHSFGLFSHNCPSHVIIHTQLITCLNPGKFICALWLKYIFGSWSAFFRSRTRENINSDKHYRCPSSNIWAKHGMEMNMIETEGKICYRHGYSSQWIRKMTNSLYCIERFLKWKTFSSYQITSLFEWNV